MEIQRLGIKIFAAESASVELADFIPVFHTWIQKRIIENHLLVDIHDYSHINRGPGILLVAHEGNFSIDMADDRLGLLYYRKQPLDGSPEERFATIVKTALRACRLLEEDPALAGRLRFQNDEMMVVANDRLHAPNDSKTFAELEPILSAGFKKALNGGEVKLESASGDPRERLTVRAVTSAAPGRR
jgi:hypothetical protein